jgi:hypothetical protein
VTDLYSANVKTFEFNTISGVEYDKIAVTK